MAKTRYHFNTKSLTFERIPVSIKEKLVKVLTVMATGAVFASVVILLAYNFFSSPKEKMLNRELEQYKVQYKLLDDRLERMAVVLEDLEHRDDNIYRVIFESEPIPKSQRMGGFGGADRYENLKGYDCSESIIETTQKLDLLANRLYVQSKSFDEVFDLAKRKDDLLKAIPAIQPIDNKDLTRLSSFFGYRIHPIFKRKIFHEGLDFTAPVGTKAYATGDGVVVEAKRSHDGYGNKVIIDHGFGYSTMYAHLHKINVRRGQKVSRGQVVGLVGNTGLSRGPHLHYEVHVNGKKVNPIYYIFQDLSPEEYDAMISFANKSR